MILGSLHFFGIYQAVVQPNNLNCTINYRFGLQDGFMSKKKIIIILFIRMLLISVQITALLYGNINY